MRRCVVRVLSIGLLFITHQALGEDRYPRLQICNKIDQTIRFAAAQKWRGAAGWISSGWNKVEPGTCTRPLTISHHDYFYAETLDGTKKWRPQDRRAFCVDFENDFTIKELDCHNPNLEFGRFAPWEGVKKLSLR